MIGHHKIREKAKLDVTCIDCIVILKSTCLLDWKETWDGTQSTLDSIHAWGIPQSLSNQWNDC